MLRNSTLHPILVIDGDLDHRRTIMATLLDQGFAVMPARVARQGIDYLLSIEPRLLYRRGTLRQSKSM